MKIKQMNPLLVVALAALAVLGYPRAVAVNALQGVDTAGLATDEIVRAALKRLF